jgi:hypothetical protein
MINSHFIYSWSKHFAESSILLVFVFYQETKMMISGGNRNITKQFQVKNDENKFKTNLLIVNQSNNTLHYKNEQENN